MHTRNIVQGAIAALAVVMTLLYAAPAQAFYLEVPQAVKQFLQAFRADRVTAQEGQSLAPPPSGDSGGGGGTVAPPAPPSGGESGSGSSNGSPSQPPPPPPPSGSDVQRDGANFQKDGPNFQRDGANFQMSPDVRQGAHQLDRQLNNFDSFMKESEQQGVSPRPDTRERMQRTRQTVDMMKSGENGEGVSGEDAQNMEEDMRSMEDERRRMMEEKRQLEMIRRGMRGAEQGLTMFKKQLARLEKQKIVIPADIKELLDKITSILAAVKNAKTMEDIEAAGAEELQELMQSLQEKQHELEMLARWPQTVKQVNRELANINREMKRAKGMVDRLAKKGIDLSGVYASFVDGVAKLTAARDNAAAAVAEGNAEEGFSLLENEFFGQMQDVWENHRIIMTLSNLGQFQSEFKRHIAQAKRTVATLKRKKLDVSALEELVAEAQAKGDEVFALIKSQDLDEEAISTAVQELENIKEQFEERAAELTGGPALPWEVGKQQFSAPTLSVDVGTLLKGGD